MSHIDRSAAPEVYEAFTALMRWAQRGDVRRSLLGAASTMTTNDITLLRTIGAHGPVRLSDLAAWQGVDKSTVTPQVRRLEGHGVVSRQSDPGDGRAALLTVTGHGWDVLKTIDETGVRLFGQALDGWSGDDRQALAALMQRLAAALAVVPDEGVLRTRRRD